MKNTVIKNMILSGLRPAKIAFVMMLAAALFASCSGKGKLNTPGIEDDGTPVAEPAGGNFEEEQLVTLSTSLPGAVIRYTTDGSSPGPASPEYSGPIGLEFTTTIKAIAVVDTDELKHLSPVLTESYTIKKTVVAKHTIDKSVGSIIYVKYDSENFWYASSESGLSAAKKYKFSELEALFGGDFNSRRIVFLGDGGMAQGSPAKFTFANVNSAENTPLNIDFKNGANVSIKAKDSNENPGAVFEVEDGSALTLTSGISGGGMSLKGIIVSSSGTELTPDGVQMFLAAPSLETYFAASPRFGANYGSVRVEGLIDLVVGEGGIRSTEYISNDANTYKAGGFITITGNAKVTFNAKPYGISYNVYERYDCTSFGNVLGGGLGDKGGSNGRIIYHRGSGVIVISGNSQVTVNLTDITTDYYYLHSSLIGGGDSGVLDYVLITDTATVRFNAPDNLNFHDGNGRGNTIIGGGLNFYSIYTKVFPDFMGIVRVEGAAKISASESFKGIDIVGDGHCEVQVSSTTNVQGWNYSSSL